MGSGTCISLDTANGDDGLQSVRVKTKSRKGQRNEEGAYRCQMEIPQRRQVDNQTRDGASEKIGGWVKFVLWVNDIDDILATVPLG
jgi:hypothetical protein